MMKFNYTFTLLFLVSLYINNTFSMSNGEENQHPCRASSVKLPTYPKTEEGLEQARKFAHDLRGQHWKCGCSTFSLGCKKINELSSSSTHFTSELFGKPPPQVHHDIKQQDKNIKPPAKRSAHFETPNHLISMLQHSAEIDEAMLYDYFNNQDLPAYRLERNIFIELHARDSARKLIHSDYKMLPLPKDIENQFGKEWLEDAYTLAGQLHDAITGNTEAVVTDGQDECAINPRRSRPNKNNDDGVNSLVVKGAALLSGLLSNDLEPEVTNTIKSSIIDKQGACIHCRINVDKECHQKHIWQHIGDGENLTDGINQLPPKTSNAMFNNLPEMTQTLARIFTTE